MSRSPIPDWVLRDVLARVDRLNNVGPLTEILIKMMQEDPRITFARAEVQLRALGSNTYLLAFPAEACPPGLTAQLPTTGDPAASYLWVCLHGYAEALQEMRTHKLTTETNLTALETCGVLCIPEAEES